METVLAYVTTKDKEEARKLAMGLLEKRLVGCVNILEGMNSFYWWQGRIEESQEAVMILKTQSEKMKAIVDWINSNHSYECPCVLFLPVVGGNPDYLQKLSEVL